MIVKLLITSFADSYACENKVHLPFCYIKALHWERNEIREWYHFTWQNYFFNSHLLFILINHIMFKLSVCCRYCVMSFVYLSSVFLSKVCCFFLNFQFNSIFYVAPIHNNSHLMAIYIVGWRVYNISEETPAIRRPSTMQQWEGKTLLQQEESSSRTWPREGKPSHGTSCRMTKQKRPEESACLVNVQPFLRSSSQRWA